MASPSLGKTIGASIANGMGRALRTGGVALSVLGYVVIGPMGYLPFAFFCWRWRNQPEKSAYRLQTCIQQGFRFTVRWLRFWRVADCRSDGVLAALPEGACVVVCNHPTQLDVQQRPVLHRQDRRGPASDGPKGARIALLRLRG